MTKSDTDRAISEVLEPLVSDDGRDTTEWAYSREHWPYKSPRECWDAIGDPSHGIPYGWSPLDWHSPAGSMRLLVVMLEHFVELQFMRRTIRFWLNNSWGEFNGTPSECIVLVAQLWLSGMTKAELEEIRRKL